MKQCFGILILALLFGASAGRLSQTSLAATPTPAPTASSDEINSTPSPNGRWMAVVNTTAGSLDLQQPNGPTINIFPPGSTANAVTWSPDSRRLLVVRTNWTPRQPLGTGVDVSGPIEIWQIELPANTPNPPSRLYQSPTPLDEGPQQIVFGQWAPNSRYVLFWEGMLSASILADGLPLSALDVTTGQVSPVAEMALVNPRYQSWAPDSSAVAVTAGGYRSAQVNKWLNLWDAATGQVTTAISQTEQIPGIVAWSPQGDVIAYAAVPAGQTGEEWADLMTFDNPAIAGRRIYLLDPATGQSHRLNQARAYQDAPLWSEDGSILYYVERRGDAIQLMSADPATGQAEPVPGASQPIETEGDFPQVGYYGQSNWDALLAQRPAAQAATPPAAVAQATATPPPPGAAEMELVRFIFKNHPPVLGTLAAEFLKTVEAGEYRDFRVQEVDLAGDNAPEILVSGRAGGLYLFVAILSRDAAGQLNELFFTDSIEGKYLAEVQARAEGRRVIADFLTSTGGTGYLKTTWEQRWIECPERKCLLVWSAPLLVAERTVTWTASRKYAVAGLEQPDGHTVYLTIRRFGLKELPLSDAGAPPGSARWVVGPDTRVVYRREAVGQAYQLQEQTQPRPGQEIAREFDRQSEETQQLVYEALSQPFYQADGTFDNDGFLQAQAALWGLPAPNQPDDPTWGAAYRQPDIAAHSGSPAQLGEWVAGVIGALDRPECRLTALRHSAGKFTPVGRLDLPCTANFTRLAWLDLSGDGRQELLLLTIPPDAETAGQVERLHVYRPAGNKLAELATLDGVINGPDGVGIRWAETAEGVRVEAGRPLVDPEASPTWSDIRLERAFETYEWDEESKSFRVAK